MSGMMRFIRNPFRWKPKPAPPKPISDTLDYWLSTAYSGATWTSFWLDELHTISEVYSVWGRRYGAVSFHTGVPPEVVCAIHFMECSGSWIKVLHNGQTLKHVDKNGTTWEPKGRGKGENWSWEAAAIDALNLKKGNFPKVWDVPNTLNFLEGYNGLGYRLYHMDVNTPYLWSGTQYYTKGKYVKDGKFDKEAISSQIGCVPILKTLGFKSEDLTK